MRNATTRHYFKAAVKFSPSQIRQEIEAVEGFNAKFAVLITSSVGTMACAYLFCVIALASLPATLVNAGVLPASTFPKVLVGQGLIGLVSWIAQTFLQLVLLSIILVGQAVQSKAADARSQNTFDDTEEILRRLDLKTEGGITDLRNELVGRLDAIDKQLQKET